MALRVWIGNLQQSNAAKVKAALEDREKLLLTKASLLANLLDFCYRGRALGAEERQTAVKLLLAKKTPTFTEDEVLAHLRLFETAGAQYTLYTPAMTAAWCRSGFFPTIPLSSAGSAFAVPLQAQPV